MIFVHPCSKSPQNYDLHALNVLPDTKKCHLSSLPFDYVSKNILVIYKDQVKGNKLPSPPKRSWDLRPAGGIEGGG